MAHLAIARAGFDRQSGIRFSPRTTAWYSKSELTFADLLNAVRLCLWRERIFPRPAFHSVLALFSDDDREQLIQLLAAPF